MSSHNHKFTYSYDAPTEAERREIEDIKKQYTPKTESRGKDEKLKLIRQLDTKVKRPPLITAVLLGIFGVLLFGLGLTMVLEWKLLAGGITIMAAGCIPIALAHPVHVIWLKRNKQKYGEEIIKLSEELLNE